MLAMMFHLAYYEQRYLRLLQSQAEAYGKLC